MFFVFFLNQIVPEPEFELRFYSRGKRGNVLKNLFEMKLTKRVKSVGNKEVVMPGDSGSINSL